MWVTFGKLQSKWGLMLPFMCLPMVLFQFQWHVECPSSTCTAPLLFMCVESTPIKIISLQVFNNELSLIDHFIKPNFILKCWFSLSYELQLVAPLIVTLWQHHLLVFFSLKPICFCTSGVDYWYRPQPC